MRGDVRDVNGFCGSVAGVVVMACSRSSMRDRASAMRLGCA